MYDQQGVTIQKASNGYIVITPLQPPTISAQEQLLRNQVDYIKEALHGDPLLKGTDDDNEGEEAEERSSVQIRPMQNVFVFIDFKDVISFLRFYM